MKWKIHTAIFSLLLSACVTTTNLEPGNTYRVDKNSSIIVLGVEPGYRVQIAKGKVNREGVWTKPLIQDADVSSRNGFIIIKLKATKANERYAITKIKTSGDQAITYVPCNESYTPVFATIPNSVAYLGNIVVAPDGEQYSFNLSENWQQADQFMSEFYPDLEQKLKYIPATPKKVSNQVCRKPDNRT